MWCEQGEHKRSLISLSVHAVSPRLLRKAGRPRMRTGALISLEGMVPEAQDAFPSLQTEVWSWGCGEHGQLGQGDCLPRYEEDCLYPSPSCMGVKMSLCVGPNHCASRV